MILSVSRRTDIPNYYSEWFLNRVKEGFLYVRNPMNPRQISKVSLSPKDIDCIVFWTKNPEPMLQRLDELNDYNFYFQFTLTGYGRDMEPGVPHKKESVIPVFQKLSDKIGREKMVWRYDPIIFTDKYTPQYHLKAIRQIAGALHGYTNKCVISFVDIYAKNKKNLEALDPFFLTDRELALFAGEIAHIAGEHHMEAATCAEKSDLSSCGIKHNCCIDKELISRITGCGIRGNKDKNQRKECGCMESIDVGTYNSCKNGCLYCYANATREQVSRTCGLFDPHSPLLCGTVSEEDNITVKKMTSLSLRQMTIWDA